jgi:hypothetical protein
MSDAQVQHMLDIITILNDETDDITPAADGHLI